MQVQKIIEDLGYSPREAKIYIAALHLGECHVSDIAAKVKMPVSSVQAIVDRLHKEGLLNFYVMRRYKYWVAENPERLLANFKKKEEAMREALPALTALKKSRKQRMAHEGTDLGLFRIFADTSSQPILIANEEIEIEYVNAAWEKQFGYLCEEVKGQNPRVLQSGNTSPQVYKAMWKALNAEKIFQSKEIVDRRKDGTFFQLLTTIFTVRHSNRLFFIQILDDLGEGKRVEATRQRFVLH